MLPVERLDSFLAGVTMGKGAGWKQTERRVAAALGGVRTGNRGTATADIEHDWLAVEIKHTSRPPQRVEAALIQAERAASDGQLPVAIIHTTGKRGSDDLLVMRLGDFAEWFGNARS